MDFKVAGTEDGITSLQMDIKIAGITEAIMKQALEQAKKQGLLTISLTGYDGGKAARSPAIDHSIVVVSDHVPRIQEAQATVYHALLEVVFTCLARK